MSNSVWFEGIDQLNTVALELERKSGQVGRQTAVVVRRSAHAIEGAGQQLVRVDTGATKNSIGVDFRGDGRFSEFSAEIGPTTEWAPFLEWGTSRMAPHAFMGPALDRHSGDFVAAIEACADPFDGGP